jgi:hypothetical protein
LERPYQAKINIPGEYIRLLCLSCCTNILTVQDRRNHLGATRMTCLRQIPNFSIDIQGAVTLMHSIDLVQHCDMEVELVVAVSQT